MARPLLVFRVSLLLLAVIPYRSVDRNGVGAWQIQAVQRGYEMLGRYLNIFSDKVEVGLDDKQNGLLGDLWISSRLIS